MLIRRTKAEQRQALTLLPTLLENPTARPAPRKKISESATIPLATGGDAEYLLVSDAHANHPQHLSNVPGLCVAAFASETNLPAWAGNVLELSFGPSGPSRGDVPRSVTVQTQDPNLAIGVLASDSGGLKKAVADLSRAFARVIEEIARESGNGGGMAAG